jgi:hypothetical protein
MRRFVVALIFLVLAQGAASAQTSGERKGWGYVFGAVGGRSNTDNVSLHVGGGGEALLTRGLGLGGEVGYYTTSKRASDGFGLASVNLSYHFGGENAGQKLVPFVTGGGSVAFRSGSAGGGNFGGGAQYWASDNVALRFEFRDHIFSSDSPHAYEFRFGISFR